MTLALYVGNAIKDLVCSPRPLGVPYGRQRLRLLGAQGEEAELNAKVGGQGTEHAGAFGGARAVPALHRQLTLSARPLAGLASACQAPTCSAQAQRPALLPSPAQEYGLPSSHTLNSLCLNYFAVWYLYDRQLIAAGTTLVLYCLVALWVSTRSCYLQGHLQGPAVRSAHPEGAQTWWPCAHGGTRQR